MQLLAGTGAQRAGKSSQVLLNAGAQTLSFASWKATLKAEDLSTVNFNSYNTTVQDSFDEGIHAVLGCDVQFGGDWDAAETPFGTAEDFPSGAGNPPGLYPRDDLANVLFVVNRNDQSEWNFGYLRIRQSENSSEVRQKVTFNCSGMNQGYFTYPTGVLS